MARVNINITDVQFLPLPTHFNFKDLTGRQFKGIRILGLFERQTIPYARYFWLGQCECGNYIRASSGDLLSGDYASCGCRRLTHPHKQTHGKSQTPEYSVWKGIRDRCRNSHSKAFVNYGERGIELCERWNTFENFLADMGERPTPKHTIERVDNERGYSPDNCEWAATREIQANNKRNNTRLAFNSRTQTLAQWSKELGFRHSVISNRLKRGWSVEKALTTPTLTPAQVQALGVAARLAKKISND